MGPIAIVLISGVSAFQGVKIYSSNGDTFRSFRAKCPLNRGVRISEVRISGVPLYIVQGFFFGARKNMLRKVIHLKVNEKRN